MTVAKYTYLLPAGKDHRERFVRWFGSGGVKVWESMDLGTAGRQMFTGVDSESPHWSMRLVEVLTDPADIDLVDETIVVGPILPTAEKSAGLLRDLRRIEEARQDAELLRGTIGLLRFGGHAGLAVSHETTLGEPAFILYGIRAPKVRRQYLRFAPGGPDWFVAGWKGVAADDVVYLHPWIVEGSLVDDYERKRRPRVAAAFDPI
jgi:hypothetical protein